MSKVKLEQVLKASGLELMSDFWQQAMVVEDIKFHLKRIYIWFNIS